VLSRAEAILMWGGVFEQCAKLPLYEAHLPYVRLQEGKNFAKDQSSGNQRDVATELWVVEVDIDYRRSSGWWDLHKNLLRVDCTLFKVT
jgi:hypothetical protein